MRKLTVCCYGLEERHRDKLRARAEELGYTPCFHPSYHEAQADLRDSEVILGCEVQALEHAEKCRWFCSSSAGVEGHLASPFLKEDVILTNSSGAYGTTISEHILMVTLMLLRRQMEYTQIVAEHRWERALKVRSIHGSRILLLGTGDIGHETAVRLRAFHPDSIIGVSRTGRADTAFDRVDTTESLDTLLPDTDILVMSLPGGEGTRQIMDARRIALLPKQAMVINVGRGSTIDQEALLLALKEERLAGAALDVFETEPIPAEDPAWDTPNLLITPHCSGNVSLGYTVDRIVDLFLEDLERYTKGEPLAHAVDRTHGY